MVLVVEQDKIPKKKNKKKKEEICMGKICESNKRSMIKYVKCTKSNIIPYIKNIYPFNIIPCASIINTSVRERENRLN